MAAKKVTLTNGSEAFVVLGAPPAEEGCTRLRPLEMDTKHEDEAVADGILDPKERLGRSLQIDADDPRLAFLKKDAGLRLLAESLGIKVTGLQPVAA